ncbi:unnamed protein product [Rotaria sp. Silwood2]|nr:unnamed protein product [Rotaria sp. Silwood2]CAF3244521.1 unnamed protein product [Rotaria sp. Silwood2]CAF3319178.1 unnamed protein product [Rotaria sp. Silwood2]CAF4317987.1 unnamed protein product [Rotaria sp. Silwood2]CAF4326102.1 unnamed protein product [Rotaria sp. Silwood2]
MSSMKKDDSFSTITTQSGKNGIVFKNYHFGMKRKNKNGTEVWICTHKMCNASININESSIVKTSSIKPNGSHEFEHQAKMSLEVYECIKSIKRRIEEEPTVPVTLLYDQQVKKFRRDDGSTASIPVFDRVKSSLYEYRSSKYPPVPRSLSSIDIPYQPTRTLSDQNFLSCNNHDASVLDFAFSIGIKLLGSNVHWNADELILIDFETTAYHAFSKSFPTAKIKRCQFHFGQNIWRQIKKKGLVRYSYDDDACRQIANILMLPLLPPQEIITAFTDIIEAISNINQNFLKLTDYVLRTCIEEALFPPPF